MARRIQRSDPIPDRAERPTARSSGSVPGRREVVADAAAEPSRNARSAGQAGRAVANVYGGPVAEQAKWSGPDLGPISVNRSRK